MRFKLTKTQALCLRTLLNQCSSAFIVGGAVRDKILGKEPKDIDFATREYPNTVSRVLREERLTIIPDQRAMSHGTVRVVDQDTGDLIDFTTLRQDIKCNGRHAQVRFTTNILTDLERRDFTINAMACQVTLVGSDSCETDDIIDPYAAKIILESDTKRIQFVGNAYERIEEDALRMIRACRFTALGDDFSIEPLSLLAIQDRAYLVKNVSKERVRDEIMKALKYPKPSAFFKALLETSLLQQIMPDMVLSVGCTQNIHHAEEVWEHLMMSLDAAVELTPNPLLRLAVVTHDIAKPHTKQMIKGDATFYKHDVVGEQIMRRWMREYKFSNDEVNYVCKLVRHHLFRFEDNSTDKAIRHWLQEVGRDTWRDLMTLRCCDRKGNLAKAGLPMITSKMRELMEKVENMITTKVPLFKEDLVINGNDLKDAGIPPGRIYKNIFSQIMGIVIKDPERNNREWLMDYVNRVYVAKENNNVEQEKEDSANTQEDK